MRISRTLLALFAVVALHPRAASAQKGSGSVSFGFTTFLGPMAITDAAHVTTFPSGTSTTTLTNHSFGSLPSDNLFSFVSRPFTDVALGQDFVLGITTVSPNGPKFNQTLEGHQ